MRFFLTQFKKIFIFFPNELKNFLFLLAFFLFIPVAHAHAATLYWVGADGANVSVASNWSTTNPTSCSTNVTPSSSVPGPADQMNFDADCDNSATIDADFEGVVNQIVLSSGYVGTVTLQRSLQTNSAVTLSGGVFTATAYELDVNGVFTMNAGAGFTAPSTTASFGSTFTINGGNFSHNNGTVIFDGGTVNIICNNILFNLVTFNHASNINKTISSTCTLPVGNNPSLTLGAGPLTLNGVISGSGTFTKNSGGITLNTGSSLTGFNAFAFASLIISGGTVDYTTSTSFSVINSVTISSGSLSLPNNADLNGALNISGGTFNAPSGNMYLGLGLSISNPVSFNANGGTVTFDGTSASATLICNNATFNQVVFNNAGSRTINSDCTLPLGVNPTLAGNGNITLNGILSGTGTLTKSSGTLTLNSGSLVSGFTGFNGAALTIGGGSIDLSNYSSFIASNNVTVNSGLLSLPNGADLNAALNISGGTFNAPSGTMTLAGALTITGSPTFNANGGTITFDGGGAVLACNNVTFNLITFNNTGTKTVNSDCDMPLGANPTIGGTSIIILNGTLSGSGTLTKSASTLTLNSGYSLTGFTGLDLTNLTIAGPTFDANDYSPFIIRQIFTMNSGSFTALAGEMIIGGGFSITSGTFNHNNGTIIFSSGLISCANATFNSVKISTYENVGGGNLTIYSGCNFPLGANPIVNPPANMTLRGTLSGTGKITIDAPLIVMNQTSGNSGNFSGFNELYTERLEIANSSNIDFSDFDFIDVDGLGIYGNSTFTASPLTKLRGTVGFSLTSGTFNHNNGTLEYTGTDQNLRVRTNVVFYNIKKETSGTLYIGDETIANAEYPTIQGTLTLKGEPENLLKLRPLAPDAIWNIDPQGARNIEYVDVKDSNNINANAILATNSIDSGNNTNWLIQSGNVSSISSPSSSSNVLRGTAKVQSGTVANVQYQVGSTNGTWRNCVADDGNFNTNTEQFSCTLPSSLSEGNNTIYILITDSNGNIITENKQVFIDTISPSSSSSPVRVNQNGNEYEKYFNALSIPDLSSVDNDHPMFCFSKAYDNINGSGITSYTIRVDGRDYLTNIPYSQPVPGGDVKPDGDNAVVKETDEYWYKYSNDNKVAETQEICVYGKGEQYRLHPGMHSWSVKTTDQAGNSVETSLRRFLVKTSVGSFSTTGAGWGDMQTQNLAGFSQGEWFPVSILQIGNRSFTNDLSTLNPIVFNSEKPITITSTNPTLYGIANSGSTITLTIDAYYYDDTIQQTKREQVIKQETTANASSEWGINLTKDIYTLKNATSKEKPLYFVTILAQKEDKLAIIKDIPITVTTASQVAQGVAKTTEVQGTQTTTKQFTKEKPKAAIESSKTITQVASEPIQKSWLTKIIEYINTFQLLSFINSSV